MRALTLLVPGLFPQGTAEIAERLVNERALPALAILIGRAERGLPAGPEPRGYEADICALFGIEARGRDLPIAALTRLAEGEAHRDGVWMRADPVYLRPDLGKLLLFDAYTFRLERAEAEALVEALQPVFIDHGLHLAVGADPRCWHLRLTHVPAIRTWSPAAARGRHVDPFLPAGPDQRFWHRLANEVQISLHAAGANRAREARGEVPINSLWFWGAGSLPAAPTPLWGGVWSQDPLARGLARFAGCPTADPPADAVRLIEASASIETGLVVLGGGEGVLPPQDPAAYQSHLLELERAWFSPLVSLLRRGRLRRLVLQTDGLRFELTPRRVWRLWRRAADLNVGSHWH